MSNEIPEIEPCVCGVYPSLVSLRHLSGQQNNYNYVIERPCLHSLDYVQNAIGMGVFQCVSNWNKYINQEKLKKTYPLVCEKDWKEKKYEEYLEARKALISLQIPFSVHALDPPAENKAMNILFKFMGCEFLEDARKEMSCATNAEEIDKIIEKYFSIFSGETDDK